MKCTLNNTSLIESRFALLFTASEVKRKIIELLRKEGLPVKFFKPAIEGVKVKYQGRMYSVRLDELNMLELARHQSRSHDTSRDYPTPHILHLCENELKLIAKDITTGEEKLLTFANRSATDLLLEYYRLFEDYEREMNKVVETVWNWELDPGSDDKAHDLPSWDEKVHELLNWVFYENGAKEPCACFNLV